MNLMQFKALWSLCFPYMTFACTGQPAVSCGLLCIPHRFSEESAQTDVSPYPQSVMIQLAELSKGSCLCLYGSALPCQLLSSLKSFSSTLLSCPQHLPYLTVGSSSAEHLSAEQAGFRRRRCRGVRRVETAGGVTPADLLQPTRAQCSAGHFFTRENIYFGRGRRETENKLTLTNPL